MAAIPVRVEPPGENPVVEVAYDGQEVTQPPLTMGENLAKQARKIDFSQDSEQVTGSGGEWGPEQLSPGREGRGGHGDWGGGVGYQVIPATR
mgnify:CR=1 FL=1